MSVFYYLSILSPVVPIFFFIFFRPDKNKKELWVAFFYVIFSFSVVSIRFFLSKDPAGFILLFTLIDYTFIFFILRFLFKSRTTRTILTLISFLFVIYIASLFFFGSPQSYYDTSPIESIIILIFCIIFLFEQLNRQEELFVYSTPGFWIVLAFLVYTSGTLFLHIFKIIDFKAAQKWWVINQTCNIITNCLIALAFLINYRNSKSNNPSTKTPYLKEYKN